MSIANLCPFIGKLEYKLFIFYYSHFGGGCDQGVTVMVTIVAQAMHMECGYDTRMLSIHLLRRRFLDFKCAHIPIVSFRQLYNVHAESTISFVLSRIKCLHERAHRLEIHVCCVVWLCASHGLMSSVMQKQTTKSDYSISLGFLFVLIASRKRHHLLFIYFSFLRKEDIIRGRDAREAFAETNRKEKRKYFAMHTIIQNETDLAEGQRDRETKGEFQ